jgi:branched-chain amino acid transport system ATP-binding protein
VKDAQGSLEVAYYACVLQTGSIVMEGKPHNLLRADMIKKVYLGL